MDNKEFVMDELYSVESRIDEVVDRMIEKYGRFLTLKDAKEKDPYIVDLVANYNNLMMQKEYLINQLNVID